MDKNTADATAQERISTGLPFVEALARRLASGMPHSIDLSDLVQDGMIGLIDAAHRFDESRGIKFETFAERRVRGAMIDALRRDAWPRGVRRMRRELESAREKLRHQLGCEPSLSDLADHMGTDEAQLGRTIVRINTIESTSPLATADAVDGANLPPVLVPSEPPAPDKVCEHAEVRRRVRGAIAALPWRERTVIGRYYYSDLTMKQIGAEIGVNESRVSQLHTRAIRRLREGLGADFAPNALHTALDRKRGPKLAMAKASLAATRAGERAPARGTDVAGRGRAGRRTAGRAPRTRLSTRRPRALEPIVARRTGQVAAAS
ncbi:MAG: FliA/WhiG family RNA polymerase sigma factor [Acidobacteria bacterium]|nr:FliA/WhiG family RNA polymerase sigma factor [Acidobacteriota bacterium]